MTSKECDTGTVREGEDGDRGRRETPRLNRTNELRFVEEINKKTYCLRVDLRTICQVVLRTDTRIDEDELGRSHLCQVVEVIQSAATDNTHDDCKKSSARDL
jgi:hypothetical protein